MKNRWIQLKLRREKEARPSNKKGEKLEYDDSGACRASYRIGSSRTASETANANAAATGAELYEPNSSRDSSDESGRSSGTLESGSWFRTSPPNFQVHEFSTDDLLTVTR